MNQSKYKQQTIIKLGRGQGLPHRKQYFKKKNIKQLGKVALIQKLIQQKLQNTDPPNTKPAIHKAPPKTNTIIYNTIPNTKHLPTQHQTQSTKQNPKHPPNPTQ